MARTRSFSGGGGGSVSLVWDRQLSEGLLRGKTVFLLTLQAQLAAVAEAMENFARATHPWQNRTGAAERTFTVRVVGQSMIEARHGVPYGIWLEVKYGGRWGIIPATLDYGRGRIRAAYATAWAAAWGAS